MRILYGVVGHGMGHATRSRTIISHLIQSHDVVIAASAGAYKYLSRFFSEVVDIEGLQLVYKDHEVDQLGTVWDIVSRLPTMLSHNLDRFLMLSDGSMPDVVVSDFDSFAYLFGQWHGIPVISIDNLHILARCRLDVDIPQDCEEDYWIARQVIGAKLPDCYRYMITSFFFPEVCEDRTSLFPPVLRPEILAAVPTQEDHILVYQTAADDGLLRALKGVDAPFRVYGFQCEKRMGNLWLRGFSEEGFVEDLRSCRGVVATGGFSLMSEAVYLGKPFLAIPIRKQFEQILNSLYLQDLGYGEYHRVLTPRAVERFLGRLDDYARNLTKHHQDGNTAILSALDALLAGIGHGSHRTPDADVTDVLNGLIEDIDEPSDLFGGW